MIAREWDFCVEWSIKVLSECLASRLGLYLIVLCVVVVYALSFTYLNLFRSRLDELRIFLEVEAWEVCPVRSSFNLHKLRASSIGNKQRYIHTYTQCVHIRTYNTTSQGECDDVTGY